MECSLVHGVPQGGPASTWITEENSRVPSLALTLGKLPVLPDSCCPSHPQARCPQSPSLLQVVRLPSGSAVAAISGVQHIGVSLRSQQPINSMYRQQN